MKSFKDGKYKAQNVLGAGVFGIVWLAKDDMGNYYAIK